MPDLRSLSDSIIHGRFPENHSEVNMLHLKQKKLMPDNNSHKETPFARRWFLRFWHKFCRLVVKVFYRRFEVVGLDAIPENTGLILCANHINALADVVILQASTDKDIRPLARSGLFDNPFLKPILDMIGAIPIYRQGDEGSNVVNNKNTFSRCYEILAANETLIIFPEGQSRFWRIFCQMGDITSCDHKP
jgi:1-acyl-sn-glycerol-3-phosphate acyltransferase